MRLQDLRQKSADNHLCAIADSGFKFFLGNEFNQRVAVVVIHKITQTILPVIILVRCVVDVDIIQFGNIAINNKEANLLRLTVSQITAVFCDMSLPFF